jgi:hypothetical protein
MPAHESPDVKDRLRAARPETDDPAFTPDVVVLDAIVAAEPRASAHRRVPRWSIAATATAATVGVAFGTVALVNRHDGSSTPAHVVAPTSKPGSQTLSIDSVHTIAAHSATRLQGTGRATITFDDGTGSTGTTNLAFAGRNVEMTIHFAGESGRRGFDAQNKSVDGEFYLFTPGPDGVSRWYHDTNAGGSSFFDTDPRSLLGALAPEAAFVAVGTDSIDGVRLTHLRATNLDALPALKLSLGPIDANTFTSLDLWIGPDDVVRRLDLTTAQDVREIDPSVTMQKRTDGTITIVAPDGTTRTVQPGENIDDAMRDLPHVTRTIHASYSVRFHDLGAPIAVTAPPGATDVAGKG